MWPRVIWVVAPLSSRKLNCPTSNSAMAFRQTCRVRWLALPLVRVEPFFKGQPQLAQSQPNPSHTQVHLLSLFQLLVQFLHCHVRLSTDLLSDPLLLVRRDPAHRSVHHIGASTSPVRDRGQKSFSPNPC